MTKTAGVPWELEFEAPEGVQISFDAGSQTLQAEVTNDSLLPHKPSLVAILARPNLAASGGNIWVPGDSMHAPAFVSRFGEEHPDRPPANDGAGPKLGGGGMIVLTVAARAPGSLLIGALSGEQFDLEVSVRLDQDETRIEAVEIAWDLEDLELEPGRTLALPPVLIVEGHDPWDLADGYGRQVATRAGGPRRTGPIPTGWCSWYELGREVTAADTGRNLASLPTGDGGVRIVQIDDGFQAAVGDWLETSPAFGATMPELASEIRDAGFVPGLWLAPLLLHEQSRTLREHPGLVLADAAGRPLILESWLGRCAVVDTTRGETEQWLGEIIDTVVHDWGFEYLKLDALQFAAQSSRVARYAATGTTGPAHLRRALQIIRRAAGPETFILGCTSRFGPAIGLVDAMRVGPDVAPMWSAAGAPSLKDAAGASLLRGWMNGRWWVNDPDCLIARMGAGGLTPPEVRLLASTIALSGGSVLLGDDFERLSAEGREYAYPLLPPVGVAARPDDPAESPVPSVWRSSLADGRGLLGVFNWTDQPRWVGSAELLAPGEIAFDVWRGEALGRGDLRLEPHEGTLWQTSLPGETPRTVGDSGHVAFASLFERRISGRLQLRNDGGRSRTVAVEARGRIREVELAPGEMRWFD